MIEDLKRQFAALEATVRLGFTNEARRHDSFRQELAERHDENRERLERIEEKQDLTNGNVIRHEAEIRHLKEGQKGSWESIKTLIAVIVATATIVTGIMIWILKLVGKL